jgi:hypothetical protein
MKRYLILITISLVFILQSCFVISNRLFWDGQSCSNETSKIDSPPDNLKPYVSITVGRQLKTITIPFFFIDWNKKDYGISFDFGSKLDSYKAIDSLTYIVYNGQDSILLKGLIKTEGKMGNFTNMISKNSNIKSRNFASFWTENIYKIPIKNEPFLKIDFIVYISTNDNKTMKFIYSGYNLKRVYAKGIAFFQV